MMKALPVLLLLLVPAANAASLPLGNWSVDANGFTGVLTISSIDVAGNVTGTIFGDPIRGFWNEAARELVFYRVIGGTVVSTNPSLLQVYTAYLFPAFVLAPFGSQRLAGSFEAFAGTGGTAPRHTFGWYAAH
jgi:hypothetical protein